MGGQAGGQAASEPAAGGGRAAGGQTGRTRTTLSGGPKVTVDSERTARPRVGGRAHSGLVGVCEKYTLAGPQGRPEYVSPHNMTLS